MEFNKLVKDILSPVLDQYGFEITEEQKNVVIFKSALLQIRFVYNERDYSFLVQIVTSKNIIITFTDDLVKNAFNSDLPIQKVGQEIFVENLKHILESKEGVQMLKGENVNYLKKIFEEGNRIYSSKFK